MSVIWSGITEEGAVVPVQVTAEGKVVAVGGGNIEGQGAVAWATVTNSGTGVLSGFNIQSCTKTGTGNYQVLFTNPLINNTYCVVANADRRICSVQSPETTGFQLQTWVKGDGSAADLTAEGGGVVVYCDGVAPSLRDKAAAWIDSVRDEFAEAADNATTLPSFSDSESQVIVTPDNDIAS